MPRLRETARQKEVRWLSLALMSIQYVRAEGQAERVKDWASAERYVKQLITQKKEEVRENA